MDKRNPECTPYLEGTWLIGLGVRPTALILLCGGSLFSLD